MKANSNIVISQSMLFPWVGMLEQIKLADFFVRYDDVQYSKGSFVNRVQLKFPDGPRWMTVPLQSFSFGQRIDEIKTSNSRDWRQQHLQLLIRSLEGTPYFNDAIDLVEAVYKSHHDNIGELSYASLRALVDYFGLAENCQFIDARDLDIPGNGTDRVLSIVQHLKGGVYVTGHGARNYLDHNKFEYAGISVQYMRYRCLSYPQLYGDFNPYLSALDLVANCGPEGVRYIQSTTIDKKEFDNEYR